MGARSGGGAGGSGGGMRAYQKEFKARTSQARTPFEKGSAGYKEAQAMANKVFNSADTSWGGYGSSMSKSLAGSSWDMAAENVKFATDFVGKHGNSFEKSVAQSIGKTIRPSGKGKQVAFVSQKQAWVMGKALSEMHVKASDFPW